MLSVVFMYQKHYERSQEWYKDYIKDDYVLFIFILITVHQQVFNNSVCACVLYCDPYGQWVHTPSPFPICLF